MKSLFNLYWFDTRTGEGYPTLEWTYAMPFSDAVRLVYPKGSLEGRRRHREHFHLELHYEPAEVHQKYTAGKQAK